MSLISGNRVVKRIISVIVISVMVLALILPASVDEAQADTKGVSRVYGPNRYETSIRIAKLLKKEMGVSRFDNIIVASGMSFPDALSGSYLAKAAEAPILLTDKHHITDVADYIQKNLKAEGTVYILGGRKAVNGSMDTNLRSRGIQNVVRLAGETRFETNTLIIEEGDRLFMEKLGKLPTQTVVCSGLNYPDALAAGASGLPIVLVNKKLEPDQVKFLSERQKTNYVIAGGETVVPAGIENTLKSYGAVSRLYDQNRFSTAVKIAKRFFGNTPKEVIVVTGANFADGLSVAPLAQLRNCPILLTESKNIAQSYNYSIDANNKKALLIGGPNIVSVGSISTTQSRYRKGFIRYSAGGFIFVKNDNKVANTNFFDYGMTIKASAGGMIEGSYARELERRMNSASYGTAIVIDISDQKLDYVENGRFMFTTDIVTGDASDDYDTPTGEYYVVSKNTDVTMSGYNSDGSRYTSYADYWLGFIGNEYGMHDASWRSEFGGDIYKYNGSHGCVNVPPWRMGELFRLVRPYTPVIVKD